MNARERMTRRPLLFAGALAVTVCALADAGLYWSLAATRKNAARQSALLGEMQGLRDRWQRLQPAGGPAQATLAAGIALDPSVVREIADKAGVGAEVGSLNARTASVSERLQDQLVSLKLQNVTRENLARFLYAVEAVDPAIRTRTLDITTSPQQAGLVNATVEFSAYAQTN